MKRIPNKQLFTFGIVVLMLLILPAAFYLSQNRQESRSRASASTTLYFTPETSSANPYQTKAGQSVSFDLYMNPGTNSPSSIKLQIVFDAVKFQVPDTNFFVLNTTAFPIQLESPVKTQGNIYVSASIGSDATKAIQTTTKVGTLTLTALAPTDSAPTTLSFGSKTQVLSVATQDQATENVLSTTSPAYIAIAPTENPTGTITPLLTPVITSALTPAATTSPTITTEATPTATTSPTITSILTETPTQPATLSGTEAPSPTSPPSTRLALTVFMHGIGNSGDNANPNSFNLSNKTPQHVTKNIMAYAYDTSNKLAASASGTITFDQTSGNYKGRIDFGNALQQGDYTIKVKEQTHLRRLITGIHTITPLVTNAMPDITLIAGDVNNDNVINIADYNILIGCYSDLLPPVACTDDSKLISDLNDDSFVNQIDYNLFLREITVQNGN